MKKKPSLTEHELSLLRHVADHMPITVGDAAKSYGAEHGLARTTVLTMVDRLRGKGYLERTHVDGVYQYSLKMNHAELLAGVVGDFVQRSLGGSLSPFVAYLENSGNLSESEIEQLRSLVKSFKAEEEGRGK